MKCLLQHANLLRVVPRGRKMPRLAACKSTYFFGSDVFEPPTIRREHAHQVISEQAAVMTDKEPVVEDLGFAGHTTDEDILIARQRHERLVEGLNRQASALAEPCCVIDGKGFASEVRAEVKRKISCTRAQGFPAPGLTVVMVGDRRDSASYVKAKECACKEVGITPNTIALPEDVSDEGVLALIHQLNADPAVDGILVQLPLPRHLNSQKLLQAIDYKKDVDGFHSTNVGFLAQGSQKAMVPCTPKGCMEILKRSGVDLQGKFCAVIGASNIVGLPMALLLLRANATVEILHKHTGTSGYGLGIGQTARQADVLIVCCGVPRMVTSRFLRPGGVVIDVGINMIADSSRKSGTRMVGDVNFEDCLSLSSKVTPVPGGVGPMTVAMLMENVFQAYLRRHNNVDS